MSETSRCRERLAPFCIGDGIDIGFGGDPINDTCIRFDLPSPYTRVGPHIANIVGDCRDLDCFPDERFDYIYSSHLIEDFYYNELVDIIFTWQSKLKSGGKLVLYAPDQQKFLKHCAKTGQGINLAHKEPDFDYWNFVQRVILPVKLRMAPDGLIRIHGNTAVEDYSWEMVLEKSTSLRP